MGWVSTVEAQTTIRVPADHPSIQAAINAASNGDTVLVAPGTYLENIEFLGKAIRVVSEEGPEVTVIDGAQKRSVVRFYSGEGRGSSLEGFTVRNGLAGFEDGYSGGGITTYNIIRRLPSSPTIIGNIITANGRCGIGIGFAREAPLIKDNIIGSNNSGGICIGGSAEILDNVISGNSGSGIFVNGGDPRISDNRISGNQQFGIDMINDVSNTLIVQNLIVGNGFSGVRWSNSPSALVNNTIADNTAEFGGGATSGTLQYTMDVMEFNNNIFAFNTSLLYGAGGLGTYYSTPIVRYNNFYANVPNKCCGLSLER